MEDENDILREKRDILIDKLRGRFKEMFENPPTFTEFNKGGYAMNLGIKPLNCDFDIDVGLEFQINKNDYLDPVEVKQWVYEALGHRRCQNKKALCCRTISSKQRAAYHVDFDMHRRIFAILLGETYLPRSEKWELMILKAIKTINRSLPIKMIEFNSAG
jgi:hypothetical protein